MFVGNAATAVQNQRGVRRLFDFLNTLNIQNRRFFISAVRRADHNRKRAYPRFLYVLVRFVRVCVFRHHALVAVRRLADVSKFSLDANADVIAKTNDVFRFFNIAF